MSGNRSIKNIFRDPEFWAIVVFNLFLLVTYYTDEASARTVVIAYYLQSVLIGFQYFIRMVVIAFRNPGIKGRFGMPIFFAIHYGGFHLVYFIFIFVIAADLPGEWDFKLIGGLLLFMAVNMLMSLFSDVKKDIAEKKAPGSLMFQPYIRIVPMHLLIMMGFNTDTTGILNAFLIFVALKTVADLGTHVLVNRTYIKRRPTAVEGWI
ncbi:MAG: hypothetical protein KDC76_02310 [Bacteroidetes bacterium]|nr:hypothetical protein [Bacteroidota bacterium]